MNFEPLNRVATQFPHFNQLLPIFLIGFITSIVEVTTGVSYATLIFSGSLSNYLAVGISILLLTSIISRILLGFTSSLRGVLAQIDESTVVILATLTLTLQTTLPNAPAEEILLTTIAAIFLSALISGMSLFLLGWLRLAELIRFIPYPVIGGFLAGMGWLLVQGGIQVSVGEASGWVQLLSQADLLVRWLPGLSFAVLLLIVSRRYSNPFILPVSLLATTGIFFLFSRMSGVSIADLRTQGWLLENFPSAQFVWQSLNPSDFSKIQWNVLLQQFASIQAIVLINAIDILLCVSALELVTKRDLNLNRELKATGIVNMISGLSGGLNVCHSVFDSSLAHQFGATHRLLGLVSAGCISLLLFHLSLLSYVPKLVLGGLLIFLGLSFLVEWLYDTRLKLTRSDYLIIVLILLIVMTMGLLVGISIGIAIAIIFFVINYSRVRAVRHILSGATYQSQVARPIHQTRALREQGHRIYILELQGFLFFGTANHLIELVRQRLQDTTLLPLRFVVLDFRLVTGLDSSAAMSFAKLRQTAEQEQFQLIFTHLSPLQQNLLRQSGCIVLEDPICCLLPDLDQGVEWSEDQILAAVWRRKRFLPLPLQLKQIFSDSNQVSPFMQYLEPRQLAAGEILFQQGSKSEAVYFLESGQISLFAKQASAQVTKLQILKAGTLLGELDFYTGSPYSTTAIADQLSTVYRLSRTNLEQMQQHHENAAATFQDFVIQFLADRLLQSQKQIDNLRS